MEPENVNFFIAFFAGLLSFVSPCVLPLVPAYVGYLTGSTASKIDKQNRPATFMHALSFVLGFSAVFVALGASVGLIGSLFYDYLPTLRQIGGLILIVFGLNMAGVLKIPFLYYDKHFSFEPDRRWGYLASFLVGTIFAVGWTPCVGYILSAILFMASTTQTVGQGAYLLFIYSLGLGLPFLAAGIALGEIKPYLRLINRHMQIISIVSGVFLILMGIAIIGNWLLRLNAFFGFWTPL
ncbi:MAG: cytochrome c biogenesis protein CcdA [Dehalococcoidia bacterium]|nr:cytochrome c biogenesis protein CcdA [Dehalococcoidia bacterium]